MAFKILYNGQIFDSSSTDNTVYRLPNYTLTPFVDFSKYADKNYVTGITTTLLPKATFYAYTASTATGGGTVTGATNGLRLSGTQKIKLGGALTGNTSIVFGTNILTFSGSSGSMRQNTSNGFASAITMQSVQNNGLEVMNLQSNGISQWNIYNTSGVKGGDVILGLSNGVPVLNLRSNPSSNGDYRLQLSGSNLLLFENNAVTNTKFMIGSTATPTATVQIRGRGTTTGVAFQQEDSSGSVKTTINDAGFASFTNKFQINWLNPNDLPFLVSPSGTIAGASNLGLANVGGTVTLRALANEKNSIYKGFGAYTTNGTGQTVTGLDFGKVNSLTFTASHAGGQLRGFYWNPSIAGTFATGVTHLSMEIISGTALLKAPLAATFGPSATGTQLLAETVQIKNDQNAATYLGINNANNTTTGAAGIFIKAGASSLNNSLQIYSFAPNYTSSGIFQANRGVVADFHSTGLNVGTVQSASLQFWTNNTFRGGFTSSGTFSTLQDVAVDNNAKGFILKDNQATPHYWRVTVSNTGVLTTTDIGTTIP
jgi:hypothetical protein